MLRKIVLLLVVSGGMSGLWAAEWTQFRGPGGAGIAESTGLPTTWSEGAGVIWKSPLPGFGTSSPIVLGDRVYLTCYSGYGLEADAPGDMSALRRHVVCLDVLTGELIWNKTFEPTVEEKPYRGFQRSTDLPRALRPQTANRSTFSLAPPA